MDSFVRTIVVLTALNLAMANSALAGVTPPAEPADDASEAPQPVAPPEVVQQSTPVAPPAPVVTAPSVRPQTRPRMVTISGSSAVGGVVMKGLPGNPVSGPDSFYSAMVEHGWSGTVMPVKEGYTFKPPSRVYARVATHLPNQDYAAILVTFNISGTTGLEGVMMQGLPGNPLTGAKGHYSATVDYGWSGTIAPKKQGYRFRPAEMRYTNITGPMPNHNYVAEQVMLTISGAMVIGGSPIQGVKVVADNGGGVDITDRQGRYTLQVPYGWSGTITLEKEGFVFDPPSKSYRNVTRDINVGAPEELEYLEPPAYEGRFVASRRMVGRIDGRKVLVIPTAETKVEDIAAIHEDMYVMSHIFDKTAKMPRLVGGLFPDYGRFFGRDSRDTEAIYIQGYGALFLMEVDLPISAAPKPKQEKPEGTQEHVDPTWQKARDEIFLPKAAGIGAEPGLTEYGPDKIEELRTELIKALKHAANIRSLKPDEWIILTVVGGAQQPGRAVSHQLPEPLNAEPYAVPGGYGAAAGYGRGGRRRSYGTYGYGVRGYGTGGYSPMGFPSATVLTIRAKKADVDVFAKDQMDFDEFQDRVLVFTYPHLSGQAVGGQRHEPGGSRESSFFPGL